MGRTALLALLITGASALTPVVYCEDKGDEKLLYISVDAAEYESYAGGPSEMSLVVPEECLPFKHVFTGFNPVGHPAWDGKDGGYGVPHWDFHFYTITEDERVSAMGTCVLNPNAGNCNADDPANAAFLTLPDPLYTTGFSLDGSFGGHAVPGHGMHLLYDGDLIPGGPALCESTGPAAASGAPPWLDCLNQQLSILSPTPDFVDLQCTCGAWTTGVSPVLITYDGAVVAQEIMPTLTHSAMLGEDLPNPYRGPYPAQDEYAGPGFRAVSTWSYKPGDGTVQFGLVLRDPSDPCFTVCAGRRRRKLLFGAHTPGDECDC